MDAPKKYFDTHDHFDVSLSEIISRLIENRWMVFIFFFCSFVVASYFVYRQVDQYESQLLMQVDSSRGVNEEVLTGLKGGSNSSDNAANQIFLIQSRFILEPVIKKLGLNIYTRYQLDSFWDRWFKKNNFTIKVSKFDIPKELYNKKFSIFFDKPNHIKLFDNNHLLILAGPINQTLMDASGLVVLKIDSIRGPIGSRIELYKKTCWSMVDNFAQHLKVNQLGWAGSQGTGILQLVFRGSDISETVTILNEIAHEAEEKDIQKRSKEATKTLNFLNRQLPITKSQLESAEEKLNQYRAKSGKFDIKMQSQILLQKMVAIDSQIEKLQLKRIEMRQKYMPAHPYYQRLIQKIKILKKQRTDAARSLVKQPSSEQIAINLMREVSVKKMLYMILLNKMQELEVVQAGTLSSVHVLTRASLPELPIQGKGKLYYIFSAIVASLISLIFVIIKSVLYRKIEDPMWVEKHFHIPNLAIIPYSKEQIESNKDNQHLHIRSLMLLADTNPRNLSVEALRSLRTSIQVNLITSSNNVISILGITPGVGKSFISANLGYLLASTGKKVLIIDGDLRKGTIHKYMNLAPTPGLSDLLNEKVMETEAIQTNVFPNLDVLVRGQYPHDPSELLMKHHFKQTIDKLSKLYDIVIFDTPPILMVTDALIISGVAANNYLVLGARAHEPHDIELVINRLRSVGVKVQGSIFNFNRRDSIINGSYSKYAYYNNDYRSYYADEKIL